MPTKSLQKFISERNNYSRASAWVDDFNNDVPECTNVEEVSMRYEKIQEIAKKVGVLACNLYAEHVVKVRERDLVVWVLYVLFASEFVEVWT